MCQAEADNFSSLLDLPATASWPNSVNHGQILLEYGKPKGVNYGKKAFLDGTTHFFFSAVNWIPFCYISNINFEDPTK